MIDILNVGDRVTFAEEKQSYVVKAVSKGARFAICTKPFNARKTVLYSIVDFEKNIRSADDRIFGGGYETQEQIDENMRDLESGELGLSRRREAPLNIVKVTP